MKCLLIRQPYASLISEGFKRLEYRSVNCKYRGPLVIASSKGLPLKTGDTQLNEVAKKLPRGKILARANLINSFLINNDYLKKYELNETKVRLYNQDFNVFSEPIGEPVIDVLATINDDNWKCYAWEINNVVKINTNLAYKEKAYSTWLNIQKSDLYF